MSDYICCPQCGNKDYQVTTETTTTTNTTGSGYSGGKGCLGYLMFGPLGLLCGSCGKSQSTTTTISKSFLICSKCGKKFRNPNELEEEIEKLKATSQLMLKIMLVLAAILAIIFFAIFAEADIGIAFLISLLLLSIFGLVGFASKKVNDSIISKKEDELQSLESAMRRFFVNE